ncbi:hypothetical protein BDN67DRAFT_964185 [Paxillus ammoniavirescens]|nr:hypothetical protein BDN67DRAFT_964185 [Paxillus ammoniavirescens]
MTITEFAILVFSPPHSLSDATVKRLFQKLSTEQSECSRFPLLFFTNPDDSSEVHLITGWDSVEAHEAWIRGGQNQELLRVFAPYIDLPKIRMVHLDIDFQSIPKDVEMMVVERHGKAGSGLVVQTACPNDSACTWFHVGRDLAESDGDIYHFASTSDVEEAVEGAEKSSGMLMARWKLRRVEVFVHD